MSPATTEAILTSNPVAEAALSGLSNSRKSLSPWLFYDERGSELFESITELPEYYLTRTERALFSAHAGEILELAATPRGEGTQRLTMLELGSGSSSKTGVLLAAAVARQGSITYQPVDVSPSALAYAEATLTAGFPGVTVTSQVANYTSEPFTLSRCADERALALYIGSSIGNFSPAEARDVLRNLRQRLIAGDALLLGVDLAPGDSKSVDTLISAYDDAAGVTAAFNLNVLVRLNRELDADFDVSAFKHEALWSSHDSRVEMHLRSRRAQTVTIAGEAFRFAQGETIHTENSYKFTVGEPEGSKYRVEDLLVDGGFSLDRVWTDQGHRFAVLIARAREI